MNPSYERIDQYLERDLTLVENRGLSVQSKVKAGSLGEQSAIRYSNVSRDDASKEDWPRRPPIPGAPDALFRVRNALATVL